MGKLIIFLGLLISASNSFGQLSAEQQQAKFQEEIEIEKRQADIIVYSVEAFISIGLVVCGYLFFRIRKREAENPKVEKTKEKGSIFGMLAYGLLFAVIGLVLGYFFFGQIPLVGRYVNIEVLLGDSSGNALIDMVGSAILEPIRQKILICGAVGFISGLLIGKR